MPLKEEKTINFFTPSRGFHFSSIGKSCVKREQVKSCSCQLIMSNKTTIKQTGKTALNGKNPKTNIITQVSFFVVNNILNCLLGLQTLKEMNLNIFNAKSVIANLVKSVSFQGDQSCASPIIVRY